MMRQPEARRFLERRLKSFTQKSHPVETATESIVSTRQKPPLPLPGEKEYGEFLETLELRHISKHEVFSAHRRCRNGVRNTLPPRELWRQIRPTLILADGLRNRLGVPLTHIASAYRCPDYNSQCPGAAKFSQHIQNRALDIVFACPSAEAFSEAIRMRAEGLFRGGLGLYSSFIHIDTRGSNATWGV